MELLEAIRCRHSVRQYTDRPLPREIIQELETEIAACNAESGLHIRLVTDEPDAFQGVLAHYGKFSGVRNYLALIGPKGPELDEKLGYYGARLTLKAVQLGLVGGTDVPEGQVPLRSGTRRKACLRYYAGLWREPRRPPQEQGPGTGLSGGRPHAGLVPGRC